MKTETEINPESFFEDILAAIEFNPLVETIQEAKPKTIVEQLNSMIARGVSFDVLVNRFDTVGDRLDESEKHFLSINRDSILCTLQQALLMKYLFSHSKDLFSDFAFEMAECESLIVERAGAEVEDSHFQSVFGVTQKWFSRLLSDDF
jgi:hypothetical protein